MKDIMMAVLLGFLLLFLVGLVYVSYAILSNPFFLGPTGATIAMAIGLVFAFGGACLITKPWTWTR